jgi:GNAT superfamily N-acetyltransferase
MTVALRAASPRDAADLFRLIQDHAAFEQSAASLTLRDLENILAAEAAPARLIVADNAGVLLGYAAITFDWSLWRAHRFGHLDCLFVAQAARGRGIGKRLLDEAVRHARSEGVDRLEWQTPTWNEDAIRLYVREGAHCASKMRFALNIL